MNSLNLKRAIDKFLDELSEINNFFIYLDNLSKHFDGISGNLLVIASGQSPRFNEAATNINVQFSGLNGVSAKVSHRQFYRELDAFILSLGELKNNFSSEENCLIFDEVNEKLSEFSDLYDEYVRVRNASSAQKLLENVRKLNWQIKTFIETLRAVRTSLEPQGVLGDEDSQISIILPDNFSLKDFAERLLALQSMYSELCALFDVSELDYPLRIGKVESGSLWAWLFGNTKIIELISTFIKQAASFAYRNFTTEGKLNALPQKMEKIEEMLNLTHRLEAAGFDTAEMKPNIEKAAFAISRDLATLIDGQSSITVNDEKLSLQKELAKALLERREVRLLESKPEPTPDEGPTALPE